LPFQNLEFFPHQIFDAIAIKFLGHCRVAAGPYESLDLDRLLI
jgi:hypothetical protein